MDLFVASAGARLLGLLANFVSCPITGWQGPVPLWWVHGDAKDRALWYIAPALPLAVKIQVPIPAGLCLGLSTLSGTALPLPLVICLGQNCEVAGDVLIAAPLCLPPSVCLHI